MAKIDKETFFSKYRTAFGSLNQSQVDNLNILIDAYESDESIDRLTQFSYILATIFHECAGTWKPIHEEIKEETNPDISLVEKEKEEIKPPFIM